MSHLSCILQLLDEETGAVQKEPWKPGELLLRSEAIMKGYLNNAEETKKVIDNNKWLHTGNNSFPFTAISYRRQIKTNFNCLESDI